ncbi:hypothetical protein EV424DRAFT_1348280 [Suillus variegatus]|nr:hypothetical protein EV424DRAFT_1348280 [Suillus variegatus]
MLIQLRIVSSLSVSVFSTTLLYGAKQKRRKWSSQSFSSRGIRSHEQSCLRRREKKKDDDEFAVLAAQAVEEQIKRKEVRRKRKRLLKEQAAATHNIGSPSSDPSTSFQDRAENAPDEFIVGPSFETVPDVDVMSISGDSRWTRGPKA